MTQSTARTQLERDAHDAVDAAGSYAARASEKVEGVIASAEQTVRHVAEQAEQAGERVTLVAGNMRSAIDKSLNEQPMTTLIMAGAVGFILGALWKS